MEWDEMGLSHPTRSPDIHTVLRYCYWCYWFCYILIFFAKKRLFEKITKSYKVLPKVIGTEESEQFQVIILHLLGGKINLLEKISCMSWSKLLTIYLKQLPTIFWVLPRNSIYKLLRLFWGDILKMFDPIWGCYLELVGPYLWMLPRTCSALHKDVI